MDRCSGCPMKTAVVGSRGNPCSPYVVVGQSPGQTEAMEGEPFIGPSGQMLDAQLQKAGLPTGSTDMYVTNAVKCYPGKNEVTDEMIMACRPTLEAELAAHPRKLIIALGGIALKSVSGNLKVKITGLRGKLQSTSWGPVLPSLHPAAIMRNGNDLPKFVADMKRAVEIIQTGKVAGPGQIKYRVIDDVESFDEFSHLITDRSWVAADIETQNLDPRVDDVIAVGIAYKRDEVLIFTENTIPLLGDVLASETKFVWHNGKFDTTFLRKLGFDARQDDDTMLAHYALDETRGTHDLKQLAGNELGADDYEYVIREYLQRQRKAYGPDWRMDYGLIPKSVLFPYLAKDTAYTFQLWELFSKQLEERPGRMRVYKRILMPSARFLQTVEDRGMKVNRKKLSEYGERLDVQIKQAADLVDVAAVSVWNSQEFVDAMHAKKVPPKFNPASEPQMKWLLYHKLGLAPQKKDMKRTTQKAVLLHLIEPSVIAATGVTVHVPIIEAELERRRLAKLRSTYVDGVLDALDEHGRVHTTFHIPGTGTGRLSSADPNLQNQPKDSEIREAFEADEGKILLDADQNQAELRSLAYLSKDEFLIDCFQQGRDLHSEVAKSLFGERYHIESPDYDELRRRAKVLNFGVIYGFTAYGLAYQFGISTSEAQAMIDGWFVRCPQATAWLKQMRNTAYSGKPLFSPFGRMRRFRILTDANRQGVGNEAANFPVQSMASDINLFIAMYASEQLEDIGAGIINLVHDDIISELDDKPQIVEQAARILVETSRFVTQDILKSPVPFRVDFKIGKTWSKNAMKDYKLPAEALAVA